MTDNVDARPPQPPSGDVPIPEQSSNKDRKVKWPFSRRSDQPETSHPTRGQKENLSPDDIIDKAIAQGRSIFCSSSSHGRLHGDLPSIDQFLAETDDRDPRGLSTEVQDIADSVLERASEVERRETGGTISSPNFAGEAFDLIPVASEGGEPVYAFAYGASSDTRKIALVSLMPREVAQQFFEDLQGNPLAFEAYLEKLKTQRYPPNEHATITDLTPRYEHRPNGGFRQDFHAYEPHEWQNNRVTQQLEAQSAEMAELQDELTQAKERAARYNVLAYESGVETRRLKAEQDGHREALAAKDAEIAARDETIATETEKVRDRDAALTELRAGYEEKAATHHAIIADKDSRISELRGTVEDRDTTIAGLTADKTADQARIAELEERIRTLEEQQLETPPEPEEAKEEPEAASAPPTPVETEALPPLPPLSWGVYDLIANDPFRPTHLRDQPVRSFGEFEAHIVDVNSSYRPQGTAQFEERVRDMMTEALKEGGRLPDRFSERSIADLYESMFFAQLVHSYPDLLQDPRWEPYHILSRKTDNNYPNTSRYPESPLVVYSHTVRRGMSIFAVQNPEVMQAMKEVLDQAGVDVPPADGSANNRWDIILAWQRLVLEKARARQTGTEAT